MTLKIDISVCINLHNEGHLSRATIESALRSMKYAEHHGARCELLLLMDNPSQETISVALSYSAFARVEQFDVRDLGRARNIGVNKASGLYCAFLDGDDLFGESWLWSAFSEAESNPKKNVIVHPRINLFFGRDYSPYYWFHPDMRTDEIPIARLIVENLWTSLSFARRTTFQRRPYLSNRLSAGFGYEDWSWNVRTIVDGFLHITAPDTIHFIRRKTVGSLLENSARQRVIPDFREDEFRKLLIEKTTV